MHLMPHLMEHAARRRRRADAAAGRIEQHGHPASTSASATTGVLGDGARHRPAVQGRHRRSTCDMVVIAAGIRPNVALAQRVRASTVERGIVVGRPACATSTTRAICAVGECAAAPRHGLRPGRAAVGADARCSPTGSPAAHADAAYAGSDARTKLKVMGVELAVMGDKEPAREPTTRSCTYTEPGRGVYKKLIVRDGRLAGAILLGDIGSGRRPCMQLFDRGTPLPDVARRAALPVGGRADAPRSAADLPDDAQICNCNGVSQGRDRRRRVRGGCRTRQGRSATRRAPAPAAARARRRSRRSSRPSAGDALQDDPSAHYYVPGVPLAKPELVAAIRAQDLRSVSAVFAALAGGREDPGSKTGLASLLKHHLGRASTSTSATRASSTTASTPTSRRTAPSASSRGSTAASPSADELRRIADVADKYHGADGEDHRRPAHRPARHHAARSCPTSGAISACRRATPTRRRSAPARPASAREFCRYGVGDSHGARHRHREALPGPRVAGAS